MLRRDSARTPGECTAPGTVTVVPKLTRTQTIEQRVKREAANAAQRRWYARRQGLPVEPLVTIAKRRARAAARQAAAEAERAKWAALYVLPSVDAWLGWRAGLPPLGEMAPWEPVRRSTALALLLEMQGNVCAVCLISIRSGSWPGLDHDHETGLVRGALCTRCNLGEGRSGIQERPVYAAYREHPPADGAAWYDRGFIRREPAGTRKPSTDGQRRGRTRPPTKTYFEQLSSGRHAETGARFHGHFESRATGEVATGPRGDAQPARLR